MPGNRVGVQTDAGDSAMDETNNALRVNVVAGGAGGGITTDIEDGTGDSVMDAANDAVRVNVVAGGAGDGSILDGVTSSIKATVLDLTNSNPLAVSVRDANGDLASLGGGTQYTEDAAAAADPVGTALIMVRDDALSGQTSTDGDNIAARGTDKGELYVKHVDAIPVTDNGGSLTVDGTVTVTEPVSVDDNGGSLTVDNATLAVVGGGVEATALRVTVASDSTGVLSVDDNGGSLTVDGTVTVTATNLDVRDIDAATDDITVHGDVGVVDQLDLTNSNPLTVAIVDGTGDQITSFGGGTQYTEDAAAAANPVGTALNLVRQDTPATLVDTDGDNVAARGTNYGAQYVQVVSSTGSFVDTFGGGTQYTEDVAAAADPVGNALIMVRDDALSGQTSTDGDNIAARATDKGELYVKHVDSIPVTQSGTWDEVGIHDSGNSITVDNATLSVVGGGVEATALRVTLASDSTGLLSVDDNGGSLTVDGTVAVTGVSTLAEQQTQTTHLAAIETATELIDDAVQVLGTDTYTEATSKGITLGAVRRDADTTLVNTTNEFSPLQVDANGRLKVEIFEGEAISIDDNAGSLTIDNATLSVTGGGVEASALRVTVASDSTGVLSVDDNGGSLTVDGTVAVSSLPASTNTIEVVGDVAADVAAAGNPVAVGIVQETMADSAPGTRVSADSDIGYRAGSDGAAYVIPTGPQTWSYHENSSSALTDTSVHAAPGAGLSLYVTDIIVSTGAATAFNIFFEEGSTTVLGPYYLEAVAGRGFQVHFQSPKKITANTALTVTTSAAIAHGIDVTGFIARG